MVKGSSSSMGIMLEISLSISCGVRNAAFYVLSKTTDIEVTKEQYLDSLWKLSDGINQVSLITLYASHQCTNRYLRSYKTIRTKRLKLCQS